MQKQMSASCQKQTYSRSRCWLANSMMAKMDKPLAEVFSPVNFGNCAWAALDPANDVFAITQSFLTDPSGQSRDGLFIAMLIIEHEKKTGHSRPLDEQVPLDPRSGRRWIPTRYRSGTADPDTRSDGKLRQQSRWRSFENKFRFTPKADIETLG